MIHCPQKLLKGVGGETYKYTSELTTKTKKLMEKLGVNIT